MTDPVARITIEIGRRIAADAAEFAASVPADDEAPPSSVPMSPDDGLLAAYDARIVDDDLRAATRSRFVSKHYADAVEAGVKALNECVRSRSGKTEDGDAHMTSVFSPSKPVLRINTGRSKSDESEQRGHMQLCQGVVSAWRNPRAHTLTDDEPSRTLMMLEAINDLILVTKSATRTRKRK